MNDLAMLFNDLESATKDPCDIICEACDEYEGTALQHARALMNAQLLSNQLMRGYQLNCKKAELHCAQNDGTTGDYMLYEEAAENGVIGKLRVIINRIIQFWVDLCHRAVTTIKTKICTAQAKAAVRKMKNTVRMDATLANKKIQAPDISSALSVITKYRRICDKRDAQFVRGIFTVSEAKGIAATVSDFERAFSNATVGAAALCVVTVSGLIIAIEQEMDQLPTYVTNLEQTQSHILDRMAQTVSDEASASAMEAMQAAANFRVQLGKQELDTHMKYLSDLIKLAKDMIQHAKGRGEIVMNVMESAEDPSSLADDVLLALGDPQYFEEGVNKDSWKEYKDAVSKFKDAMKSAKDLVSKKKYTEAKKELDGANKELAACITYIDNIPQDMVDVAVGTILGSLKAFVLAMCSILPVIGLAAWIPMLKEFISAGVGMENSKWKKSSVSTADYNHFTTSMKGKLKMLQDRIAKMKVNIDKMAKEETVQEDAVDVNYDNLFTESTDENNEDLDHFMEGVFDSFM